MKASKGRRWALGLGLLTVLSAGAGAVVLRQPAYEWWQIHRLRTDGWPAARSSAQWLSERGSPASLAALIDILEPVKKPAAFLPRKLPEKPGNPTIVVTFFSGPGRSEWVPSEQALLIRTLLARHKSKCASELDRYLRERRGQAPIELFDLLEKEVSEDGQEWVNATAILVEVLAGQEGGGLGPWPDARVRAVEDLASLGPDGRSAASALLSMLGDSSPATRARALQSVTEAAVRDVRIMRVLLEHLGGRIKLGITRGTASSIADWARDEPQILEELIQTSVPAAKHLALDALWALDASVAARVPSLPRLLADPDSYVTASVPLLLARAGLEVEATAPIVLRLLDDPSSSSWSRALSALPGLGPAARAGLPALVRALKTGYLKTPLEAAGALGRLGSIASEATPALLEALEASDMWTRRAAARVLPEVAVEAGPMIAALEARLLDPEGVVRVRAAASLILLEPARSDALLPVLESALRGENFYLLREATLALPSLAGTSEQVSRLLKDLAPGGLEDSE